MSLDRTDFEDDYTDGSSEDDTDGSRDDVYNFHDEEVNSESEMTPKVNSETSDKSKNITVDNFFKAASPNPGSSDEISIRTSTPAYIHAVSESTKAVKTTSKSTKAKAITQSPSKKETKKQSTRQPRKNAPNVNKEQSNNATKSNGNGNNSGKRSGMRRGQSETNLQQGTVPKRKHYAEVYITNNEPSSAHQETDYGETDRTISDSSQPAGSTSQTRNNKRTTRRKGGLFNIAYFNYNVYC